MPGIPSPTTNWVGGESSKKKGKKKKSSGGLLGGALGGVLSDAPISGKVAGRYLFHPENAAGKLAESMEAQAANQKRQAENKAMSNGAMSGLSPFELLQQQLFAAVNDNDVQGTPLAQLEAMAKNQIAAQFDPQIRALSDEINRTGNRGKASQKEARAMYGALSKDFLAQLPEMTQQFAAEDQATNQRYDQAQGQMDQQYDQQAAEQEAVLKRLGIQAASQDASQQTQDDQSYFQNQSEMDQQASISALNEQQMAQQNYQQNLGSNARMAGENTAQDIGAQLRDYMQQAGSQMTGLQGQKSSAFAALLAQMQQQDSQNVAQQRQQEFDNQMKLYNFQLQAQKANQSALSESQNASPFSAEGSAGLTTGLPGAQNYLAGQYPDQPILASNLMEQLNDVLSNKEVTQGKFVLDPGNPEMGQQPKYSDVGQQYMEDLLRREFEQEGNRYTPRDINATMAALQAYLGKLR